MPLENKKNRWIWKGPNATIPYGMSLQIPSLKREFVGFPLPWKENLLMLVLLWLFQWTLVVKHLFGRWGLSCNQSLSLVAQAPSLIKLMIMITMIMTMTMTMMINILIWPFSIFHGPLWGIFMKLELKACLQQEERWTSPTWPVHVAYYLIILLLHTNNIINFLIR